jgi:hypothetical protein
MDIKLAPYTSAAFSWSAYNDNCIGSKVVIANDKHWHIREFELALQKAIATHDPKDDWSEGQLQVVFPKEHLNLLSCGVGERTDNPDDYVVRVHRGQVSLFLKREKALPCESAKVIVYTKAALLKDPQLAEEDRTRIEESEVTHYMVALLANAEGVPDSRSPYRLVDCLAGGNNDAEKWTLEDIKRLAKDARDYADKWEVVAD